ncbi:phage tail protein [Effusibacillus pohliae]|uniref:phage tail protein n=1 Tax=Effusibacillus pohliae TaxID=232270 RepID=UPI000370AB85|nr:hypothetical protein [Effusibacillus pohliae]
MATVGQMIVKIGANIRDFVQKMQQTRDEMQETQKAVQGVGKSFQDAGKAAAHLDPVIHNAIEMRRIFSQAQAAVRQDFVELSASAGQFAGKTDEFIAKIEELGKKQKKLADQMLANNERMKASFIQSIGAMLARSNTSDKIAENLARIGNPIRTLDQVLLKSIGSRLDELAKRGNVAVVALRELGPTANMKQLQEQVRLINQGIMRMNMLALASGAVFVGMTAGAIQLSNAIDGRLVQAFDQFKATWIDALRPFITAFTEVGLAMLKAGTAVGQFFKSLAQNDPVLSAMIFGFLYLFTALTLLLSPLAIGISRAGSLAVAFNQLWMMIKPLVTGFLTVAGTAAIIAAALVILAGVIYKLWTNSEAFRNSIINGWNAIKTTILNALAPILPAWEQFKQAFLNMVATFVGAEPSMGSIWKTLGDKIAVFINWFVTTALPMIQQAFSFVASVIVTAMNIGIAAFNKISEWWQTWGPWIKAFVGGIFENIKNIIVSAVNIISNIFQFFSNLLQGNWRGAWENIKAILSNALTLIWNWIQLWGVGRILGFFRGMGDQLVSILSGAFSRMWSGVTGWLGSIVSAITSRFQSVLNFFGWLRQSFYNAGAGLIDMIASGIMNSVYRVTSAISWVASKIRAFLPFSPAKVGPLSDLNKLDFAGPIRDSIQKGLPAVQTSLNDMLAVPAISGAPSGAAAGQGTGAGEGVQIIVENMTVREDADIERIARRLHELSQRKLRGRGVYA